MWFVCYFLFLHLFHSSILVLITPFGKEMLIRYGYLGLIVDSTHHVARNMDKFFLLSSFCQCLSYLIFVLSQTEARHQAYYIGNTR